MSEISSEKRRLLLLPQQIAPGRYTSGSYIRLIHPFQCLTEMGKSTECIVDDSYNDGDFDAVIIERIYREDIDIIELQSLINKLKRKNIKIVFTIDDNLYDLFVENENNNQHMRFLTIICFLARAADAVICSTKELATIVRRFNRRIFVFENYLSQDLLPPFKHHVTKLKHDSRIEIGYMGTITHLNDFRIVVNAIREIMFEYSNVSLHLVGIGDPNQLRKSMEPYSVMIHQPPTYEYEVFFPWFVENMCWDIALAPLQDTPLSRSKSDLKLLDYSAIGAAGIYSNLLHYKDIQDKGFGLVVENTTDAWYAAIRKLIDNPTLRHNIHTESRQYLYEHRLLEHNVWKLWEIIKSILAI